MDELDAAGYLCSVSLLHDQIPTEDRYPFSLPVFRDLGELEFHPKVTYIVGENGVGKSTLLEAIAVALGFNPEGGTRDMLFASRESHSCLHEFIRLSRGARKPRDGFFLRAETIYNLATSVEEYESRRYGDRSLHEQSHGESFFAIFMNRFAGHGLYLLDEPEAALSPLRQMAFLTRIHQLTADASQFIIATHSPIIMAYPQATIYQVTEEAGFTRVAYEDTENYRLTKSFLDGRERMLAMLLTD